MSNPIRAICFDFDGTLAQFEGDFAQLTAFCCDRLGIDPGDRAFLATYEREIRAEGHVTFALALRRALEAHGYPVPAGLEAFAAEVTARYAAEVRLLPGVREVLAYFAHLPKAVITNGPADMQWAALRNVGLEREFQAVVVSGDPDVAVRKPNPRIFHLACERLGVPPHETLMIGDHLEADVQGAIAAGLQGLYRPNSA
ncbi:HAD family hydrolase [Calidithermus chliarophilus]|uniref:HAD family hydrolase n=1 Tax=Calidithermus chliarophilus TaxID=52023 RepID=UPI000426BDFF|nr:HAD-IA family hydrolase [Calidithermus chliarophilus]